MLLLSGCGAAIEGGITDPEAADQAISEIFADTGERVLLQGGNSPLDQNALDRDAAPNAQKFAIQTDQGIFMMTQTQLNQYIAIRRAEQEAQARATIDQNGLQSPYGRVVSRTVVANSATPSANSGVLSVAATTVDPTTIKSTKSATGTYERFIAPGLTFTKGPKDMKNADGTYPCVLTIDDGPHHTRDPQIYNILDAKNVKAVFFFVGNKVKANPNTAKQAKARGHEIGYHSWDHKNLRAETLATVKDDFAKGMEVFNSLGLAPKVYRPPFGNYNTGIINTAKSHGMTVINWTNDSLDWKLKSSEAITSHVLEQSLPGDIVLMHSIHPRGIKALPDVIDGLRAQGCRFVSMQTWINLATS